MKKLAKNLAMFLLIILGCFSFVACKEKDKDEDVEKYQITTAQAELLLSKVSTGVESFTSAYNQKSVFENENLKSKHKNILCENLNDCIFVKEILDLVPDDKVELGKVYCYQSSTKTKYYRIKQEQNKKVLIDVINYSNDDNIECYSYALNVDKGELKSLNLKTFTSSQSGMLMNIEITEFNLNFETYESSVCFAQPENPSSNISNSDFLEMYLNSTNINSTNFVTLYGFEINPNQSSSDMVNIIADETVLKQKVLAIDYEKFYDLKIIFDTTTGVVNLETDVFETARTNADSKKIVYDTDDNKFTTEESE